MLPNINSFQFKVAPTIGVNYNYSETIPIKFNLDGFIHSMKLEEPLFPMNTNKKEDENNVFYKIGNKFGSFTKLVMKKVEQINQNQNKSLLTQFELGNEPELNIQDNQMDLIVEQEEPQVSKNPNTLNNFFTKIQNSNDTSLSILRNGLIETIKQKQESTQKGQLSFDFGLTEEEKIQERQDKIYKIGNTVGFKFQKFANLMMKTIKELNESKKNFTKSISNENNKIEPVLLANTTTASTQKISKPLQVGTEVAHSSFIQVNQESPIVQAQNTLGLESATGYVGIQTTADSPKDNIKNTINIFKQIASNLSVKINQVMDVPNNISHFFTLSGEEKNIKKLQKNHAELFKTIGFKSESLLSNSGIKSNTFSLTEQEKDISKVINEKFNFDSTTNKFVTLQGNNQANVKVAYLEKVIYPKLKEEIQNILTFTENINELASKNIYLNKLNKFSEKYEFDKDAVLHLLRTNPNELKSIAKDKDFNDLINNKELILDNYDRYQTICANHITYSKQIFNIHSSLVREIPRNDKQGLAFLKSNVEDSYLFSKNGKGYKIQDVAKNIMDSYSYLKQENELNISNNPKPSM